MTFVDSLYIIALINPRDQHHTRALELAEQFDGTPLLITDAIFLEIGNTLARRFKPQGIGAIERPKSGAEVTCVHLTPDLFDRGFQYFSKHRDKDWGLVDCISFVAMRDHGVTDALTHDRHFIQAGFRALMRDDA